MPKVHCDGWCQDANPIAMIGSKGYAYCRPCGAQRRESGYERVRLMRAWEVAMLVSGKPLPSYTPSRKPVA